MSLLCTNVSSNTLNTIRPPLPRPPPPLPRPRDAFVCTRVGAALSLADATALVASLLTLCPRPFHAYAVACPTIRRRNPFLRLAAAHPPPLRRPLTDAATPVPPCSTPYPPAKQWKEFFSLCRKLPIALYLGCSTLNAGRPSSAPLQVSVAFSIPPQNATPRCVHWNGCNGRSAYTTNPPGFLPGRRVNSLDTPLSPFLLYFAYGNPNPSEGSVGITSPRQIGGPEGESEAHSNFPHTALELCPATLADLIETPDRDAWRDIAVAFDPERASRQIAGGLRHLHGLKLVHRDIKPQNILVSAGAGGGGAKAYRMLISDFRLCKKLDVDQTSFLPTSHGAMAAGTLDEMGAGDDASVSSQGSAALGVSSGTAGKPARLTKSVDIFALGSLFFYTLTNGGHPFGDRFEREANIMRGAKNLQGLERFGEEGEEAVDSISSMLHADAQRKYTVFLLQ
ncbi:kinase-like domain-containing protein [Mycena olivaceomarginata]|nr:kinase-like domain-containing protein [Mycena olivaceomarginata]